MKISELRVGNWVCDDYSGYMTVVNISSEPPYIDLRKTMNLPVGRYDVGSVYPISLNEGWLEILGLPNDNYDVFKQAHGGFSLVDDLGDGVKWYVGELRYVHQLQNLYYALTGEEL